MKIRFLADANFNQKIVSGLLLRERRIDFELPTPEIRDGADDTEDAVVLVLAATLARVLVTHDQRTTPKHFGTFLLNRSSGGVILVPKVVGIGAAIEDLLLIWATTEAEMGRPNLAASGLKSAESIDLGNGDDG